MSAQFGKLSSPIVSVSSMEVVQLSFNLDPTPADSMRVSVDIDYQDLPSEASDTDSLSIHEALLRVTARLINSAEPDDVRMDSLVKLHGSFEINEDKASADADEVAASCAQAMYSHARSVLMTVTGLSPLGKFTLPSIDPLELVRISRGRGSGDHKNQEES